MENIEDITLLNSSIKNKKKYKRTQSFYFNSDPPVESKLINLNFLKNIYYNQLKKDNYIFSSQNNTQQQNDNNKCLESFVKENKISENIKQEIKSYCW